MANLPDSATDAQIDKVFGNMSEEVAEEIANLEMAREHLAAAHKAFIALEHNSRSSIHEETLNLLENEIIPHVSLCLREHGISERRAGL